MTELTSALEQTTSQIAPEQGPSANTGRENSNTSMNDTNTSGTRNGSHNTLHPNEALYLSNTLNWIYKLRKDKLAMVCERFKIDISGRTVSELRKLLSEQMKTARSLSKSTENLFQSIQNEIKAEEEDIMVRPISSHSPYNTTL